MMLPSLESRPIVLKVGGSLFSLPDLGDRLRRLIVKLQPCPILIIPGGGGFANVVRDLDAVHQWPAEVSHHLAIQTMSLSAAFLATLDPRWCVVSTLEELRCCRECNCIAVLDVAKSPWVSEIPSSWDVTSDSIAAIVAGDRGRLVLAKSVDLPDEATESEDHAEVPRDDLLARFADREVVDRAFPDSAVMLDQIGWVNLRADEALHWLRPSTRSQSRTEHPTC